MGTGVHVLVPTAPPPVPSSTSFPPSSPTSCPVPFTRRIAAFSPVPSLSFKPIHLLSVSLQGFCFHSPSLTIARGSFSDIKGTGVDCGVSESDDEDDAVLRLLDKVPLDAGLQLKLEKRMRMKVPKNVRIRRKKLIRRRTRRKKGTWPPPKINKIKNV